MREFSGDWRDLFHAFRIALDPGKMLLGLAGLIFSFAGLAVIAYGGARVGLRGSEWNHFEGACQNFEVAAAVRLAGQGLTRAVTGDVPDAKTGELPSVRDARNRAAERVRGIEPPPAWRGWLFPARWARGINWAGLGLLVAAGLWLAFVWAKIGGAIARIAAVEVAKDERLSANEGLAFAKRHFGGFFWSPVAVAAIVAVLLGCNALAGLVGAIPYLGDLLATLLLPLVFVASLTALFLAVGGAVGWPLMTPALAAEGTDAFDAVSRSMSYVYGRPFRVIAYAVVVKLYGLVCCAVVWAFAFALVKLTFFSVGLGMHALSGSNRKLDLIGDYIFGPSHNDPTPVTMGAIVEAHGWFAPVLVVALAVFVLVIFGLAAGYVVSFQYTARTLVYFLLRKAEDHTEMDEVWLDEEPGTPDDADEVGPAPAAGAGTAADPNAPKPGLDAAQQQAADQARAAGGDAPTVGEKPE